MSMTEPLTRDKETNRISQKTSQAASTNLPMVFHPTRVPLPRHVSARIFRTGRSVVTSARIMPRQWRLIFERRTPPSIDHLMGYTGGDDTLTQVELNFPTREAAETYALKLQLDYVAQPVPPELPRPNVRNLFREQLPVRQPQAKELCRGSCINMH
ncbi:ETC complex I subunit [Mesorhizobium loti]|nr:ETC complex I subunit [Mesorhizobium loti]